MAATRDYYEVLGVPRDADADALRKAYRRLARQFHPDVNGGDPAATEKFKEINQAYEVLSNADKRSRYDRFGAAGVDAAPSGDSSGGFGGQFDPFGGIFDAFFGGAGGRGGARQGPQRGDDLRIDIEVTLLEVLNGASKSIPISRHEKCGDCSGSGAKTGSQPQPCVACGGQGYVRTSRQTILGTMSQVSDCHRCRGRGQIITDPCGRCRGAGMERITRNLTVDIPPGVEEGVRLRLSGEGEASSEGGVPGDLYVFIHEADYKRFQRQGRDLLVETHISFARAALGGPVTVPLLDGQETISIQPGTQPGDVFRIRGKGLPGLRTSERGDLHVAIRVTTPTRLNERQKKLLQEFAEAGGEDLGAAESHHGHHGILEWVRNLFTGHESAGDRREKKDPDD